MSAEPTVAVIVTAAIALAMIALVPVIIATRRPSAALRSLAARRERGEGVVSVAIAVLIMAVLGAILFTAFKATTENAGRRTDDIVNNIK